MELTKLFSLSLVVVVASCSTYDPAQLDPETGTFGGVDSVADRDIRTNKPLAGVSDLPFTYFRSYSTARILGTDDPNVELAEFLRDGLQKIGFPKLVSEEELTRFVVQNGLTSEIQNLDSVLALNRLSHYVGPFLVAEFRLRRVSTRSDFLFETTIIDPEQGEAVFVVSRDHRSMHNFDREILYPMLNAIKQWFDESAKLPAPERLKPPRPSDI